MAAGAVIREELSAVRRRAVCFFASVLILRVFIITRIARAVIGFSTRIALSARVDVAVPSSTCR